MRVKTIDNNSKFKSNTKNDSTKRRGRHQQRTLRPKSLVTKGAEQHWNLHLRQKARSLALFRSKLRKPNVASRDTVMTDGCELDLHLLGSRKSLIV